MRKIAAITNFLILFPIFLLGQTQISGVVLHEKTKEPISYVSIGVLGKPLGTVSNQNGAFSLNIEDLEPSDSLGFFYIGFETVYLRLDELSDRLTVFLKEQTILIDPVSIRAKSLSGRELVQLALAHRDANYSDQLQEREVFRRDNSATYIDVFEIELDKSSIPGIDQSFTQQIVDSMIRYNRHYTDHLYTLYNSPIDASPQMGKIRGIKKIVLDEEIGGEMEQIEHNLTELFDDNAPGIFWKLKTGPVSIRLTEPQKNKPAEKTTSNQEDEEVIQNRPDSIAKSHPGHLFTIDRINDWNWEFIEQAGQYTFAVKGLMSVQGEPCYLVDFHGGIGKDYVGKLFISADNYALLRIEYQLKRRKAEKGFKLLGFGYNQPEDSGLVIYEKDGTKYHLKYSMRSETSEFGLVRPFRLIQKIDKPIFNRRVNQIEIRVHVSGRDESVKEVLVVSRKALSLQDFRSITPKKAETENITRYDETIWQGYSVIEPTKQMKEYQAKIR